MPETILMVGDDSPRAHVTEILQNILHYGIVKVNSGEEAFSWLTSNKYPQPDLILFNIEHISAKELELVRALKHCKSQIEIIVLTPYGSEQHIGELIHAGACNYITKPATVSRLKTSMQLALKMQRLASYASWLERRVSGHIDFSDIVGNNSALKEAVRLAQHAASSSVPVWIEGESGSGREQLARAIHGASARVGKPFVAVNCAVLADDAAELLLFGQEKNQASNKPFAMGKIREANGGTLLLEEVGALKPSVQQRLCTMLEAGVLTPLGAQRGQPINVRIITTTSIPFDSLIAKDPTSHKLYHRLKSLIISMPPLRHRTEDIQLLAEHFLVMYSAAEQKYVRGIKPQALEWLAAQPWPGNVHELSNTLWRALILCGTDMLSLDDVQATHKSSSVHSMILPELTTSGWLDDQGRVKPLKSVQEEAIRFALDHAGGCMTRAAKSLGIGRSTLYRKLGEFSRGAYTSRANQTTRPMMNVSSAERS